MRRVGVDGSAIRAATASNVCCEIVMLGGPRRKREKRKRREEEKDPTLPFQLSFTKDIVPLSFNFLFDIFQDVLRIFLT